MSHEEALQWIVDLQRDDDMLSAYQRLCIRREAAVARLSLYRLRVSGEANDGGTSEAYRPDSPHTMNVEANDGE